MKKLLFVLFVLTISFFTNVNAQEDRNKIDMNISYKGKEEVCKVYNVSYYFSRPNSTMRNDTSKKTPTLGYDEEYYYITVSIDALSTTLLQIVADPSAKVNGTIIMKDNYTNKQLKEIKFYDAELNNFSESLSNYSYGSGSGSSSLSIMAPRISINGVEFKAKR